MRGLYAIIDPEVCSEDPCVVAGAVLRGGCAALQLRAKRLTDAAYLRMGRAVFAECRGAGVPFFVNDRVGLVRKLGADGVHVGQTDAGIEEVRARVGPSVMIGVSTHSVAQAVDAERRGAQLIGFGPVFATVTKLNAEPVVGVIGLREVCEVVGIPVVGIGGITEANAAAVHLAGAPLGAAISALCQSPEPERAARELHRLLRGE